jgi:hypothetical protein
MQVRDIINQRDAGTMSGSWSGPVAKHDVAFLKLTPVREQAAFLAEPRAIDTSLDTIPTGYFGGSGATGGGGGRQSYHRSDAEIAELAKQRVVVIEKWEGPCWDECLANSSRTPPVACNPACGEEAYQLDTLRRVKAVNPNVSGVFYLNTLYDFPCVVPPPDCNHCEVNRVFMNIAPAASHYRNCCAFDIARQRSRSRSTLFARTHAHTHACTGDLPHQVLQPDICVCSSGPSLARRARQRGRHAERQRDAPRSVL